MRNHFSTEVKETLSLSAEEALRTHSPVISPAHILLGLIRHAHNRAVGILTQDLGLPLPELTQAVEESLPAGAVQDRGSSWRLPLDKGAERSIRGSVAEARRAGSRTIGAEHLLYALFGDRKNDLYLIFRRWGIERLP